MFQTNPNSNNNNNEDATRPVVARATHLAKLANYPDLEGWIDIYIKNELHIYYTRNETKVAQPEFVDIIGLMVNEL